MSNQPTKTMLLWLSAGIVGFAAMVLALIVALVVGIGIGRRQEATKHTSMEDVSKFLSFIDESKQSVETAANDSETKAVMHPGESKRFGDFEVAFAKAEFREIETVIELFGRKTEGKAGPFVVLTIEFTNHSEGRVVEPYSMIYKAGDNFGNDMGDDQFQLSSLRKATGDEQMKELQPGDSAKMFVCLQRKIDTAKSFKVEMAMVIGGGLSDRPETLPFIAEFDAPLAE